MRAPDESSIARDAEAPFDSHPAHGADDPGPAQLHRLRAFGAPRPGLALDAVERLADDDLAEHDPRPAASVARPMPAPRSRSEPVPDVAGARPAGGEGRRRPEARPEAGDAPDAERPSDDGGPGRATCTSPQLRRFIKSRAYVPMHELRRRFAIAGEDDDVCGVDLGSGRIYVGLPPAEGRLLGDLLRNGEVGYELSMDPETPVVVGVYAMRPVTRS